MVVAHGCSDLIFYCKNHRFFFAVSLKFTNFVP